MVRDSIVSHSQAAFSRNSTKVVIARNKEQLCMQLASKLLSGLRTPGNLTVLNATQEAFETVLVRILGFVFGNLCWRSASRTRSARARSRGTAPIFFFCE